MGGKKSRNKGANFERAIAKRLRKWLGDEWTVKRNPTDRQKCAAGAGEFEIVGPYPFPFAIECKAHESFRYGQLFRNPVTGPFLDFWDQAWSQALAAKKRPMLILKKNNGPLLVALDAKDYDALLGSYPGFQRLIVEGCRVMPAESFFDVPSSLLFEIP